MKFKFNSNLDYQNEAINAAVDLFNGQSSIQSLFSFNGIYRNVDVSRHEEFNRSNIYQGVGNKLELSSSDILDNLRYVQGFHRLAPSLDLKDLNFTIEMETGTGKTYVYLKTIFELNKKYGFTKFIIVVPNIAIKEGVYKTLQITKEHFKTIYDNVLYDYFVYDSNKLDDVRNFALDSHIKIMIINIDAFKKNFDDPTKKNKVNIIHRPNDKLNGYKPIELIKETNPIVIIDEPQSITNTSKAKEAIKSLKALCTFQYSATPPDDSENLIYKLDAIDAYEMNLVKQIEVASMQSENNFNEAYIKLVSVDNKKSPISAKVEVNVINKKGEYKRKTLNINSGDDLSDNKLTNNKLYNGYIVDNICCEKDNEYVSFYNDKNIKLNTSHGELTENELKRNLINKTIEEHLDKELKLKNKGIKVLSLFFIDKVANYRQYGKNNEIIKGKYAKIFEEEYEKLIKKPKYTQLREFYTQNIDEFHDGYFSIDNKKHEKQYKNSITGKSNDDNYTYELIMKDKEKLLSLKNPLRFIFSHSALKEGWDNPNVFQICTLNETKSNMKKRQEIGRGLRLCVNQDGERIKDSSINILTIMANESYDDFAKSLQNEMEKDEGFKFGVIKKDMFANIKHLNRKNKEVLIEKSGSQQIFNFFKKEHYIDGKGKIQETLKDAVKNNTVKVPEQFEDIREDIINLIRKPLSEYKLHNKTERREIKLNKEIYLDEEFKDLWDKIKYKTTYQVDFDTDTLVANCIEELKDLKISTPRFIYTKGGLKITSAGINSDESIPEYIESKGDEIDLPDIVSELQQKTFLTRKTIVRILLESDSLDQFKKNPAEYIQESIKIINNQLNALLIDGIKYTKVGDYYAQELFEENELYGYLKRNMIESSKSVYDHVIYESKVECNFERKLELDDNVKVYAKLPSWFKINTPIGTYNPDWAILIKHDETEEKLYFVIETKGNIDNLRKTEEYKIKCAKKHFQVIGEDVGFKEVDNYNDFKKVCDLGD